MKPLNCGKSLNSSFLVHTLESFEFWLLNFCPIELKSLELLIKTLAIVKNVESKTNISKQSWS